MIFVANYKMNGNKDFYLKVKKNINKEKFKDTIVLCPPFVYMPYLKIKNKKVSLGAQDLANEENGKSTGQINGEMLKEFDVKYSIVGHSERRELGETNDVVARKIELAQTHGINPIVCVGEKNKTAKLDMLVEQVESALSRALTNDIIFAYEPIWAIGSGEIPSLDRINSAINLIKNAASTHGFEVKVLYGGSVNAENYKEIIKTGVDGFLMGGVSLKINDFLRIVKGE